MPNGVFWFGSATYPAPRSHRVAFIVVCAVAMLFTCAMVLKSIQIFDVFGTSAYDLGIFAQSFWLLSQFGDAFNTVRGLHTFGEHLSPIEVVFIPLYHVYPTVYWAFGLQALSVAAGSVAVYYISLHLLPQRPVIAALWAVAYLLNPVVHSTLLWQYHGIVLASGPFLWLMVFYLRDDITKFFVLLVLVMACREELPVATFFVGVIACVQRRWRYGVPTMALSAAWWAVCMFVVLPYFNGEGYFHHKTGALSGVYAHLFDWQFYYDRFIAAPEGRHYVFMLVYPLAALCLIRPLWLLPAVPAVVVNVLIGGYKAKIGYHYSVSVMPFVFLAAIAGVAAVDARLKNGRYRYAVVPALVGVILALNVHAFATASSFRLRDVVPSYDFWRSLEWQRDEVTALLATVGSDGVAASDFLVPHFAHRRGIYLFPNPWQPYYWGLGDRKPHHPNNVRYVVVTPEIATHYAGIVDYLTTSGLFVEINRNDKMVVLRRERNEVEDRDEAVAAMRRHIDALPSVAPAP